MKNFFKKGELKLLWPFYAEHLIATLFILYPAFFVIYLLDLNFSLTQIGILIATQSIATLIFEVPTGAIADTLGRKISTITGYFLMAISFLTFYFTKEFYLFVILFCFIGISITLISGAHQSWIVDLLKQKKKEKLVQEYFIKRQSFVNLSLFLSGIVGASIVANFGLRIVFLITAAGMFLGMIFLLFGKEKFKRKKYNLKRHFVELYKSTKEATVYTKRNNVLFYLTIITGISMIAVAFTSQMTWQPFFLENGFQEHWFGYLFSAAMAFGIFVPYIIKPLLKASKKYKYYLIGVVIFMALLLFSIKIFSSLIILVAIFMFYMAGYDFEQPAWHSFFQKHTKSKIRATVTSLNSMVGSLITVIFAPIVGILADNFGPGNVLFIAGFIMLPMIIFYAMIKE